MSIKSVNLGAIQTTPVGFADRGIRGQLFSPNEIAREDWQRAEQAQNNQLIRDMYMQEYVNEFNSAEAQKTREFNSAEARKTRNFEERMSSTAYQRAVDDLKKAGLNPVLAYSQGSASTPQAGSASSNTANTSPSRSGTYNTGKGYVSDTVKLLYSIAMLLTGAGNITGKLSKIANLKAP